MKAMRRGAVSEHVAAAALLSAGYEVFWPAQEGLRYDLLCLRGDTPMRVQVKTAYWQAFTPSYNSKREYLVVRVNCGRLHVRRPYVEGEWDALAAAAPDGRVWLIPWEGLPAKVLVLDKRGPFHPSGQGKRGRVSSYDPNNWLLCAEGDEGTQ